MKTAEEAFKEWVAGRATENYTAQHIFKVGYEKAKADARHAALTEAAEVAGNRSKHVKSYDYRLGCSEIKAAILALRDKEGQQ